MQPMVPAVGDIGGYSNIKCSLRVKITSYKVEGDEEVIGLIVIKKPLECSADCRIEENSEFEMRRKIGGEDNPLESLVIDYLAQ